MAIPNNQKAVDMQIEMDISKTRLDSTVKFLSAPSELGSTLKRKSLLLLSKFFLLRVVCILEVYICPRRQTGSHKSYFHLKTWQIHGVNY